MARFEAEFPLGLPEEYGILGGAFLDVGSVWGAKKPFLVGAANTFLDLNGDGIPDPVSRPIRDSAPTASST